MTHFLVSSMSLAKDFSQQYILITLMPFRISFMSLILLSVLLAVSSLSLPNCFPTQTETYNRQLTGEFLFQTYFEEGQKPGGMPPPRERWVRPSGREGTSRYSAGEDPPRGSGPVSRRCRTCSRRWTEGSPFGRWLSWTSHFWRVSRLSCRQEKSRRSSPSSRQGRPH